MDENKSKIFAVVIFPGAEDEEDMCSIVPQSWVTFNINRPDECMWPLNASSNLKRLIESCADPTQRYRWKIYKVRTLRKDIEGFEAACLIEKNAREGKDSALSEVSPEPSKRAVKAKVPFSPTNTSPPKKKSRVNEAVLKNLLQKKSVTVLSPGKFIRSSSQMDSPSPGKSRRSRAQPLPHLSDDDEVDFSPRSTLRRGRCGNSTPDKRIDQRETYPTPPATTPPTEGPKTPVTSSETVQSSNLDEHPQGSGINPNNNSNTGTETGTENAQSEKEKFQKFWENASNDKRLYFIGESCYILRKKAIAKKVVLEKEDPDLSCFPITSDTVLDEVHTKMQTKKGFKKKLELQLRKKVVVGNLNETARKMCRFLFSDTFGKHYSMYGFKRKEKFGQLKIVSLLFTVLGKIFDTETDAAKVRALNLWLNYCSTRLDKEEKKKAKGKGSHKDLKEIAISDSEEDTLPPELL